MLHTITITHFFHIAFNIENVGKKYDSFWWQVFNCFEEAWPGNVLDLSFFYN